MIGRNQDRAETLLPNVDQTRVDDELTFHLVPVPLLDRVEETKAHRGLLKIFARLKIFSYDYSFPILVEQVAIEGDFRLSHIAQHIPMQSRFVPAATFREACADGKVNRASDLLIDEHVFAKALDAIISADAPFAQRPSA